MSTLKAIHAAGGHDHIAGVLDVFEDPTFYFFVLELVRSLPFFESRRNVTAYVVSVGERCEFVNPTRRKMPRKHDFAPILHL